MCEWVCDGVDCLLCNASIHLVVVGSLLLVSVLVLVIVWVSECVSE